jgi:quinoprotein glucose dehydrogenase
MAGSSLWMRPPAVLVRNSVAGGLVFIGATRDNHLRGFDIETNRLLWKALLPAGAQSTPMTYEIAGRQ